jgi:hypothetical protein
MSPTPETPVTLQRIAVALYAACQAGLVGYSVHRWRMLRGGGAPAPAPPAPWWPPGAGPRVLVQLPVCDEPAVVSRLVAAAAALDWPRDRLEIQLLDDSGAAAAALGAEAVARARAAGVNASQVRRAHRHGFKAGALAAGLEVSDAEFVAVFDADFVPAPDFLVRTLVQFAEPRVGLVQARWGHLNRDANLLTRAQAVMLDAHLLVEHAWRQRAGRYLSFNGTAGVWRRACIESAGGWSHDTLTEDLDLSYRAQLAGWRFVFDPGVVVPAELPETMSAFRTQQHRWAKGALQTSRKLLPRVFRAPLPWPIKQEAFVHLTADVTYPLLLALATLLVPVLFGMHSPAAAWVIALHVAVVAGGTLPVALFLYRGQRLAGRRGARTLAEVAAALVLCGGLSWHLAHAVAEGLWGATGEFVRTPKTGSKTGSSNGSKTGSSPRPLQSRDLPSPAAARSRGAAGLPELALASWFTLAGLWAAGSGRSGATPFLLALSAGLGWVGLATRRVADTPPARGPAAHGS